MAPSKEISLVFSAPPGPEPVFFVEAEDEHGRSLDIGEWIERPDGAWAFKLRIVDDC